MAERITAIVRLREDGRESSQRSVEDTIHISSDSKTVTLPAAPPTNSSSPPHKQQSFTFETVFPASQNERTVYRNGVKRIVESTLLGYNGTLVLLEVGEKDEEEGASRLHDETVQGAAEQIFDCLDKSRNSNLVVNCSFLAVAEERTFDLLEHYSASSSPVESSSQLTDLSFTSDGLLQQPSVHGAASASAVLELLRHGQRREKELEETLASISAGERRRRRSHHTILSLTVEYTHFGSMNAPVSGALSFVRLSSLLPLSRPPSSDDTNTTHRSLLALTNVIDSLKEVEEEEEERSSEVEEKEIHSKSMLTRLLKDSLGGNCKTVFLCEIHTPLSSCSRGELVAALRLASASRQVVNHPNKRDLAERALMSAYMKQLRKQYQSNTSESDNGGEEEERHRAMEEAANALAQAVEKGEREGEEGGGDGTGGDSKILVVAPQINGGGRKQNKKKKMSEVGGSAVTIDALVGVLQDPDRGVPRALETRLQDVNIRRDVGALFSGAGIVQWMMENVEGVESEGDAVALGQLLLDKGAIFHSEGSMVFANADSLFYYARDARHGKRHLSQDEIRALLCQARGPDSTHHITSVSVNIHRTTEGSEEREEEDEEEGGGGDEEVDGEGDEESLGFSIRSSVGGGGGERGDPEGVELGEGESNLLMSGGFQYNNGIEQWSPTECTIVEDGVVPSEPLRDHSGTTQVDDSGRPTESNTSVESWMATDENREEEEGGGEEERDTREEDDGNPSTVLQHSIPSIQTLENTVDYPHPLHMAVAIGKSSGVIKQLVMMFGVDQTDDRGRTPLMFAALGNKRVSCSTLIDCGAVIDKQDNSGLTALHVACYHGAKEATRVILTRKASVVIADKMGHTALHWAIVPESTACLQLLLHYMWGEGLTLADSGGLTAMHWAIFYNRPQHLKLILKKCVGYVEVDSSGRTLLTYAIERDPPTPQCIHVLLETCPDLLNQRDGDNRLPLHLASIATSCVPLSILLSHPLPRSSPPLDLNCADPLLRTPLHYSAAANHLIHTEMLLRAGADREAVDGEGRSALDYASVLEDSEPMINLLYPQLSQTPLTQPHYTENARPQTAGENPDSSSISSLPGSPSTHSLPTTTRPSPDDHGGSSKICTVL